MLLAEIKGALRRVPIDVAGAERGRPHELVIAVENGFDFERLLSFDIEEEDGALRVYGNEQRFAHGESIAGVENRGGFRAHCDRAGKSLGGENASFRKKIQMELAEDFQRIDPGLNRATFVAEQGCPRSGDGQKFPGTHGARKLETLGR